MVMGGFGVGSFSGRGFQGRTSEGGTCPQAQVGGHKVACAPPPPKFQTWDPKSSIFTKFASKIHLFPKIAKVSKKGAFGAEMSILTIKIAIVSEKPLFAPIWGKFPPKGPQRSPSICVSCGFAVPFLHFYPNIFVNRSYSERLMGVTPKRAFRLQ